MLTGMSSVAVSIDLADLRGYHYHSGAAFAVYCAGLSNAIALGGRYDGVGKAFGRARPATGFTLYLLDLARLAPAEPAPGCIRAPRISDPALDAARARERTRRGALRARTREAEGQVAGQKNMKLRIGADRTGWTNRSFPGLSTIMPRHP